MKNVTRIVPVLLALLPGLLMSACGGGGSTSAPPPPPTGPTITSVTVTPNPAPVTIGGQAQFTATLSGKGSFSNGVSWSLLAPSGSGLSPGTITSSGLYTTPSPAPATVTVVATSSQDSTKSGSATVTLTADAGNQTHPQAGTGGNGANPVSGVKAFDALVVSNNALNIKTLGTVPVLGWVAKDATSCSFPVSTYPTQYSVDASRGCGDGELPNPSNPTSPTNITGNDSTVTSTPVGPSWAGDWAVYLVGKFGNAANGGVAVYDLDNEPSWWDAVHRDVHPSPSSFDEVTNNGIATAKAIKTADPTAEVSGPVVDYWWNYFYSKKDIESGWNSGPCYSPWSNPVDRTAHNGTPFIEYYLQQFKTAETTYGSRLLDYVDLHTYMAASYMGNSVAFSAAGDTGVQQARLNSTRVFWDPTYTDPNEQQPNYSTDANYTASCTPPPQVPQLIPMMQKWVSDNYPGTKLAITEYNWGGLESVNGALAQADILGIFGSYGLDLGTLWPTTNPSAQLPGTIAFEIYRNYDGANSTFGDMSLASSSPNQGALSVYAALRTADNMVTVVIINKTYGDLTSTLSLANFAPNGAAKAYLYSNANPAAIVAQPDVTVAPPTTGAPTSTLSATFPAQSIILLVVPMK